MTDGVTVENVILETNAEVRPLVESWVRSLEAEGKSDSALQSYAGAVRSFTAWSEAAGIPVDPTRQSVDQVRRFIAVQLQAEEHDGGKASRESVVLRFECLQQWFQWLVDEGELQISPMARLRAPMLAAPAMSIRDNDLRNLFSRSGRFRPRFIGPGS